jgi:hypothetical protein
MFAVAFSLSVAFEKISLLTYISFSCLFCNANVQSWCTFSPYSAYVLFVFKKKHRDQIYVLKNKHFNNAILSNFRKENSRIFSGSGYFTFPTLYTEQKSRNN